MKSGLLFWGIAVVALYANMSDRQPGPSNAPTLTKASSGIEIATSNGHGAAKRLMRYVDASRLNVRSGPGSTYAVVWTLNINERVAVTATDGQWSYVTGTRYEGWVHSGYLTLRPSGERARTKNNSVAAVRASSPSSLHDAAIRKALIARSRALYSGTCPCPYSLMRNGRRCGGNSAWSRPGGASPLCYDTDVTDDMVARYRQRNEG